MSVRYYISDILPPETVRPTDPEVEFKDYYRPPIKDIRPTVAHVNRIPVSKLDGKPIFTWTLIYAATTDWTLVDADPRNFRLFMGEEGDPPNHKAMLDALALKRLSGVAPARRTLIAGFLNSKGIAVTGSESFREVLRLIRRRLDLNDLDGELREKVVA